MRFSKQPSRLKKIEVLVWLVHLLTFLCIILSCTDKTDTQPVKSEVVVIGDPPPDTSLYIITDTVNDVAASDTTVYIEPEPIHEPVYVYTAPVDSIIDAVYMSQVGVREATGNNDGKDVEKYLRSVKTPKGSAWCAAFVKWCFDESGVRTTITAWSPTAHNRYNIVYSNSSQVKEIQRGDVFTLYYPKLKRIGHTGFVRRKFGMNSLETVEGNTNSAGSREGDGVYIKIRPKSSIYSITRWQ